MVENASAVKVFVQSPLLATMSHKYCIYECYETFFMLREGCIDMLFCFFIHIFNFNCTVCLSDWWLLELPHKQIQFQVQT